MWKNITGALADGLKEFKAALDDTSSEDAADPSDRPPIEADPADPALTKLVDEERAHTPQQTPVEPHTVLERNEAASAAQNNARESASFENWEVRMLENEVARLKAEVESLKSKNKELETKLQAAAEAAPLEKPVDELVELREENTVLKKTLKQIMNKVVPPPHHTNTHVELRA